jgi:hypothetical protein
MKQRIEFRDGAHWDIELSDYMIQTVRSILDCRDSDQDMDRLLDLKDWVEMEIRDSLPEHLRHRELLDIEDTLFSLEHTVADTYPI